MDPADAKKELGRLLDTRHTGVLATSAEDRPYTSLVAFAVFEGVKELVFATPEQTRKYDNLRANPHVAILIDDRAGDPSDIRRAAAVTATGKAREAGGPEKQQRIAVYESRHPNLKEFVRMDSTALFSISIEEYILVSRFQDVVRISP